MGSSFVLAAGALLALSIVCSTVLVGLDKIDGELYMAAVMSPIVAGLIGAFAAIKGVQSGSQATTDPPPDA
jgi:hypothetical protein